MIQAPAGRLQARRLLPVALGMLLLGLSPAARAQQPLQITPQTQTPGVAVAPEAAKGAREEELEKIRTEQKKQAEIEAKLKAELDALGEDRRGQFLRRPHDEQRPDAHRNALP